MKKERELEDKLSQTIKKLEDQIEIKFEKPWTIVDDLEDINQFMNQIDPETEKIDLEKF